MWNEIDKHVREDGFTSRNQLFETLLKRYFYDRKNSDRKKVDVFSDKQMGDYFGVLEKHIKSSDMNERRRILPIVEHAYKLTSALTRIVKVDISKITKHDPLERIRLENLRKWNEYHDAHEVAATELVLTPEYVNKCGT